TPSSTGHSGGEDIRQTPLSSTIDYNKRNCSTRIMALHFSRASPELLGGVEQAIAQLSKNGRLVLVTKGDLFLHEAKLAGSGLGDWFSGVEIVSEKTAATYSRIFKRYGVEPDQAVMAGNSVRSDVLPALSRSRLTDRSLRLDIADILIMLWLCSTARPTYLDMTNT
ncbi:HAD family hydrolase, partial [Azospirillum sp. RU38E]|uniref:HAD family hydrolase n=1 Tax=unclassified Azospirillum TaxID=2630922 RepID=UPI00352A5A71